MKKILLFALVLALSFSLLGCGSTSSPDTASESENADNEATIQQSNSNAGTLGDYAISFTGCTTAKDYEGKDVIIVSYDFTNNSDEATSAALALYVKAFQNGIELENGIVIDDIDGYNSDNYMKDIKPGVTLNVQEAFVLSDTSSVEFEASEFISFSDDVVSFTYSLS